MADLIIAGLGQTMCYLWPMLRVPVESARIVAVHNTWLAGELAAEYPGRVIRRVPLGVADPLAEPGTPPAAVRRRHGIPEDAVVFGSFGRVTPEKGLTAVLRALAQIVPSTPSLRLLIVGDIPSYFDLAGQARDLAVEPYIVQTGYVPDGALADYLAAVDVCLNLRWPTGRETSAAWMRCLAAGKPTLVTDLAHQTDVPALDLRSGMVPRSLVGDDEPVCVPIDLIEDVKTLRSAMRRLGEDASLRRRLGEAARRYWSRNGSLPVMAGGYEALLEETKRTPLPTRPPSWPVHLAEDGAATARDLAAGVGAGYPFFGGNASHVLRG
jgi:glycosyltransferase involved in cell wall biosynthesis